MEAAPEDFDFRGVDDADFVTKPGVPSPREGDKTVVGRDAELFAPLTEGVEAVEEWGFNGQIVKCHAG